MLQTDDLTATIARVQERLRDSRCDCDRCIQNRADDVAVLAALASATERAERAEAERDEWRAALQGLHREWARGDGHGGAKETADCIAGRRVTMSIDHGDEVRGLTAERDAALAKLARVEAVPDVLDAQAAAAFSDPEACAYEHAAGMLKGALADPPASGKPGG